jgi:hypothetical protein
MSTSTTGLVSLATAAKELGITPDALRGAIMRGTLKVVPLDGRTNLVSREEIERYRCEHLGQRGKRKKKPVQPAESK